MKKLDIILIPYPIISFALLILNLFISGNNVPYGSSMFVVTAIILGEEILFEVNLIKKKYKKFSVVNGIFVGLMFMIFIYNMVGMIMFHTGYMFAPGFNPELECVLFSALLKIVTTFILLPIYYIILLVKTHKKNVCLDSGE